MVDQRMSLDLPEMTTARQDFSYDFPEVRCEERCDGPTVPVVVCSGFDCRVDNRPSCYPSCRVERVTQHISLDLPQITMKTHEIVIGIPEISIKRQDMYFNSISFPDYP